MTDKTMCSCDAFGPHYPERGHAKGECAEKKRASLEEAVKKKLVSKGVSEDWLDNHLEFL